MDWLLDTTHARALRRGSTAVDAHLRRHAGDSAQATEAVDAVRHHLAEVSDRAHGRPLHVRLRWGTESVSVRTRAVEGRPLLAEVADDGAVPPRLLDRVRGLPGHELGELSAALPPPESGAGALGSGVGSVPHLELSLSLPRETVSVPIVRRLAAQALGAFGVTSAEIEDVQVAITEASANVIKHAAESDIYEVQIELTADRCAITVVDTGEGFDVASVFDPDKDVDKDAESGRGLQIMRALVDNVAFRSEPRAGAVVHMVKNLTYDPSHPLRRH